MQIYIIRESTSPPSDHLRLIHFPPNSYTRPNNFFNALPFPLTAFTLLFRVISG